MAGAGGGKEFAGSPEITYHLDLRLETHTVTYVTHPTGPARLDGAGVREVELGRQSYFKNDMITAPDRAELSGLDKDAEIDGYYADYDADAGEYKNEYVFGSAISEDVRIHVKLKEVEEPGGENPPDGETPPGGENPPGEENPPGGENPPAPGGENPSVEPTPVVPGAVTPQPPVVLPPQPVAPVVADVPTAGPVETVALAPEEDARTADAGELLEVEDEEVPLAIVKFEKGCWALVNLILMLLTVLVSMVLLMGYFLHRRTQENEDREGYREEDGEDEEIKKKGLIRVCSIPVAVVSVIIFILTENVMLPMVLTDRYTIFMLVVALIQVVVAAFSKKKYEEKAKEQREI